MRAFARRVWGRGYLGARSLWSVCILVLTLAGFPAWGQESANDSPTGCDLGLQELREQFPQLTDSQAIVIRDAVGYQIAMGRSLETTTTQLAGAGLQMGVSPKAFPEIVARIYDALTRAPQPPSSHPRALALIGDRYHHPGYIREAIEQVCQKAGIAVRFVYDVRLLSSEILGQYDVLVVLRDGMLWPSPGENDPFGKERVFWLTQEQEEAVARFVANGGGFLAIHNATALKALDGRASLYHEVLGASYAGHGPEREDYTVEVINASNPVAAAVPRYEVGDERHWPKMHVSDADIFLEAVAGDRRSVHGFTRSYQKGRVCYLAHGHNLEALQRSPVQEMLVKGLRWCLADNP
ncbi:MAG: ThuA domain-containing protein [Thermogutta sp.]|uniref:ThuA domain-containing protein n=1 Tax=Thermogutta sp. TaxID=1962930 RepID=UPI0019BD0D39|nr:ThuA domain-containing protein [Thermogutta sp.]MBC7353788.1 ThuA domain-containing protein [Thermogutta sp.]